MVLIPYLLSAAYYLKVVRSKESFENAINLLKEEKSIGIFPEGTRNKTDQLLLPLRKGTTLLAKKTNAKIIPFAITGK